MDYLFVPTNWKEVYLNTESDPNLFGEALRGWVFIGTSQDVGCYTTFQVNNSFKEVKSGIIYEEVKKILCPEYEESINVFHLKIEEKDCFIEYQHPEDERIVKNKIIEPYEIVVAWYWDGDGHLYFRYNNRKVENTDCKKDYYWKWIK